MDTDFFDMENNNYILTHWGHLTHLCIGNLAIIGSDNGLSPGRHQVIIWTNARILLIGPLATNFSDISIKMLAFSFKKMDLKLLSVKWLPFCHSFNMLRWSYDNWKFGLVN